MSEWLGRKLCWFGLHRWGPWSEPVPFKNDSLYWRQFRLCERPTCRLQKERVR